jgi:steroid delta-isomerase-like uncharacterized protein
MAANQNQALVHRFFEEMCNQRKLNLASELFTNDHVLHDPQIPEAGPGPEGMKGVIATYQTAFPDANWKVEQTLVADNYVITRWTGSGTHEKELNGVPPTGKFVSVQGIWIHRIENNKIVESWDVWDTLGMFQQLGLATVGTPSSSMAR